MEDSPEVTKGKESMRQAFADQLKQKLVVLRKANPSLSLEDALGQLRTKEPGFFERLERIERGDWSAAGTEWSHSGPVKSFSSTGRRLNAAAIGLRLPNVNVIRARAELKRQLEEDEPVSAEEAQEWLARILRNEPLTVEGSEVLVVHGPAVPIFD